MFFNWGHFFFKLRANVLVEFENVFNWGIFFKLGAMGANVLVEFKMFFFNWGHFFQIGGNAYGGKCVSGI